MINRDDFLKTIQSNIDNHGYHVTLVAGCPLPRFAYTIGCHALLGVELVIGGCESYFRDDVNKIIRGVVEELRKGVLWQDISIQIDQLGCFSLATTDESWTKEMTLGVYDFYNRSKISILQILPDTAHWTLDIPDMSKVFDANAEPVWQWLVREFDCPIPPKSYAATNLNVLYGEKATEAVRWEDDYWEIFAGAGPDIPKGEMRIIPLAVLLGIDSSLKPAINLGLEKGLWRNQEQLEWNAWEAKSGDETE